MRSPASLALLLTLLATSVACAQHDGPAMNYHAIDDQLATGGHFTDGGVEALLDRGLDVVIDLREEPPAGPRDALEAAGVRWIHVPVSWKAPKPADFERFRRVLAQVRGERVLVQCAANYRASAMTYLYRVLEEQADEREARADMEAVWRPNRTWRAYMDDLRDSG